MRGLKHQPSEEIATIIAIRRARGCSQEEIAASLDLSVDTLHKYYSVVMRTAKASADDEVYGLIMSKIRAGSERLMDLYARTQLRWKTADAQGQEDATRELAAATERANAADALTKELKGHLMRDLNLNKEPSNGNSN